MAIDTLRGMRVYVDYKGEYHFLTHGAGVKNITQSKEPDWTFVGVMYPHMQEVAEGHEDIVGPPDTTT
jgi:hypothetical protein